MSTASERPLDVVLCWHMHQPWYLSGDEFVEPWVYLHALKDYADMAAHLEAIPGARAVVNFVPVLLEQVDRYAQRLQAHRTGQADLLDPLLNALASEGLPTDPEQRLKLVERCFQVNEQRLLTRFPVYAELYRFASHASPATVRYLSDQYIFDALVWFHLAWFGEHARRSDVRVQQLMAKGRDFSGADRNLMLTLISEQIASVIPRYRRLAEQGRVELSMSPWAHPILPLLLDFAVARESQPDIALPEVASRYPSGEERARWHIRQGIATFEQHFAQRPAGCWPSEGALCNRTLALLDEAGFRWTASGGGVLHNSLAAEQRNISCAHAPFVVNDMQLRCFFRDDGLSDLIGFTYKDWSAERAVDDLVSHLESIAQFCEHDEPVVSIILDGENAWEHYQHNAFEFLQLLYARIVAHPRLNLTTFSDHLADHAAAEPLQGIVAGSWVYGTLSTWIGHAEKNRAWDQLAIVKNHWDARMAQSGVDADEQQALARLLGICEGSDWFWWLGDHHSREVVQRFDNLYRAHLRELYAALGVQPDAGTLVPIGHGTEGGEHYTMLPSRPD